MTTQDANPSRNTANDDDMAGMFFEVLNKFLANNIDDMLPAIVEQYDPISNRATVRPLIMRIGTDDSLTTRGALASIPVFQLGAGGFMINVKPKQGDIGWVKANDRDISLFLQSYDEAKPNTLRKHKFADAVFFPDVMRGYSVDSENGFVIQSVDGEQKIALREDGGITIEAATQVDIGPNVNLGSGGPAIARDTDPVQVTIPPGTFLVSATGGVPNPTPVNVTGTITGGSPNHTAD